MRIARVAPLSQDAVDLELELHRILRDMSQARGQRKKGKAKMYRSASLQINFGHLSSLNHYHGEGYIDGGGVA